MTVHAAKQQLLKKLYEKHAICDPCPFLHQTPRHCVFGEGNPHANLMFIGEAPGAEEDRLKRPFVGRSGKLLDRIFTTLGFNRTDVFITNIVKCRPPNNRTPLPHEISAHTKQLLKEEIEIVRPLVICTLGSVAARLFINDLTTLATVRGTPIAFARSRIVVIPTYHPAYILRNSTAEPILFKDIETAVNLAKKLCQE